MSNSASARNSSIFLRLKKLRVISRSQGPSSSPSKQSSILAQAASATTQEGEGARSSKGSTTSKSERTERIPSISWNAAIVMYCPFWSVPSYSNRPTPSSITSPVITSLVLSGFWTVNSTLTMSSPEIGKSSESYREAKISPVSPRLKMLVSRS